MTWAWRISLGSQEETCMYILLVIAEEWFFLSQSAKKPAESYCFFWDENARFHTVPREGGFL